MPQATSFCDVLMGSISLPMLLQYSDASFMTLANWTPPDVKPHSEFAIMYLITNEAQLVSHWGTHTGIA